jgi:hypothetical protein
LIKSTEERNRDMGGGGRGERRKKIIKRGGISKSIKLIFLPIVFLSILHTHLLLLVLLRHHLLLLLLLFL